MGLWWSDGSPHDFPGQWQGENVCRGLCDDTVVPHEDTKRASSSLCSIERCEKGSGSPFSFFLGFHGAGAAHA